MESLPAPPVTVLKSETIYRNGDGVVTSFTLDLGRGGTTTELEGVVAITTKMVELVALSLQQWCRCCQHLHHQPERRKRTAPVNRGCRYLRHPGRLCLAVEVP